MKVTNVWAHRFGDKILHQAKELDEIINGLKSIKVPICKGFKRPPFDVKQGLLNKMIDFIFVNNEWKSQPYIDTRIPRESSQKGDFAIITEDDIKIFVEVEFGNIASSFRDLYKFNLAYSLDTYHCGIFILPVKNLARRIDTIQSFEGAKKLITEARNFINLPLILIGIDSDPDTELNLLEIKDDINYWKTYKESDFEKFILEHKNLLFTDI
ncbi:BglII/BstYI family type II restriction endonuclease [Winogradskyella haliclonae]|uniref:Restriction endonuclease n=1 Tax=Winogradskyella haliclonae TaxID=2048558 RepID=A0ABQ2C4R5_9FLAO|nr:BglII/BstYI family type II restriction endonuclease [Winogradskyella haliclonae]GGI58058.1 hypothetical protein GCM10011444_23670 [Winogradskyella haliclonae]